MRIETLAIEIAAVDKPDMIVFPELAITGLSDPGFRAQALTDPAIDRFVRLAMKLRIYLVAGCAERAPEGRYNAAIVAGPEGLIGSYRKIHLNTADKSWATSGKDWKVLDLSIGRVGLLIGYDALFPEAVRTLSLLGCDLIACPAAITGQFTGAHAGTQVAQNFPIPTGADPHHWHLFRVRAGESNVYFGFANVFDPPRGFLGKSGVFGPDSFQFPRQEVRDRRKRGLRLRHDGYHKSGYALSDQCRAPQGSRHHALAPALLRPGEMASMTTCARCTAAAGYFHCFSSAIHSEPGSAPGLMKASPRCRAVL